MLYLVKVCPLSSNSLNCEILGKSLMSIKIHLFIGCRVIVLFNVGRSIFLLCEDFSNFLLAQADHHAFMTELFKDRRFFISAIANSTFLLSAISSKSWTVSAQSAAQVKCHRKQDWENPGLYLLRRCYASKPSQNQTVCCYDVVGVLLVSGGAFFDWIGSKKWGNVAASQNVSKGSGARLKARGGGEGEALSLTHASSPRSSTSAWNVRSNLREKENAATIW